MTSAPAVSMVRTAAPAPIAGTGRAPLSGAATMRVVGDALGKGHPHGPKTVYAERRVKVLTVPTSASTAARASWPVARVGHRSVTEPTVGQDPGGGDPQRWRAAEVAARAVGIDLSACLADVARLLEDLEPGQSDAGSSEAWPSFDELP